MRKIDDTGDCSVGNRILIEKAKRRIFLVKVEYN